MKITLAPTAPSSNSRRRCAQKMTAAPLWLVLQTGVLPSVGYKRLPFAEAAFGLGHLLSASWLSLKHSFRRG
jgi:hypothetical protein